MANVTNEPTATCPACGSTGLSVPFEDHLQLTNLLNRLADSGVEFQDPRMSYVVVQIDVADWKALEAFRS